MSKSQRGNPLHGVTLEHMLEELVARYGWRALGEKVAIRCFTHDPSIASSLKFLRRTPWARSRVEAIYVDLVLAAEKPSGGHSTPQTADRRVASATERAAPMMSYEEHLDEVTTLITEKYDTSDEAAIAMVMRAQADDFFSKHDDDTTLCTIDRAHHDARAVYKNYR